MLPIPTYAGTILGIEEYQVKDGDALRFHEVGTPEMLVSITLDRGPIVQKLRARERTMLPAIVKAVKAAGREDLELGGYLAVYAVPAPEDYEVTYVEPVSA